MARFYLDEDIPVDVGPALEQLSHEAIHAYDLGNQATPDPEHLMIAARAGRILITFNRRDFAELHQLWTALNDWGALSLSHAGILSARGQVHTDLWPDLIHSAVNLGQTLDNQMWVWHPRLQDWERFGW